MTPTKIRVSYGGLMARSDGLSKPIIASSVAAENQAKDWTENQSLKQIQDGDGDIWSVDFVITEGFENPLTEDYLNTVSIILSNKMSAKDLINSRVLDEVQDYRLIALIGGSTVDLEMNPVEFKDKILNNAMQSARDYLQSLAAELNKRSLVGAKRKLVNNWVDSSGRFGRPAGKRLVARF